MDTTGYHAKFNLHETSIRFYWKLTFQLLVLLDYSIIVKILLFLNGQVGLFYECEIGMDKKSCSIIFVHKLRNMDLKLKGSMSGAECKINLSIKSIMTNLEGMTIEKYFLNYTHYFLAN